MVDTILLTLFYSAAAVLFGAFCWYLWRYWRDEHDDDSPIT